MGRGNRTIHRGGWAAESCGLIDFLPHQPKDIPKQQKCLEKLYADKLPFVVQFDIHPGGKFNDLIFLPFPAKMQNVFRLIIVDFKFVDVIFLHPPETIRFSF